MSSGSKLQATLSRMESSFSGGRRGESGPTARHPPRGPPAPLARAPAGRPLGSLRGGAHGAVDPELGAEGVEEPLELLQVELLLRVGPREERVRVDLHHDPL